MAGAGVVFSKDGMVNDCCTHVLFVVQESKDKVPSTRYKDQVGGLSQSTLAKAYGIETSLSNLQHIPANFRLINLGIVFANAETEDQGQLYL